MKRGQLKRTLKEVKLEVERASLLHGPTYASAHEGWAVLYEEVDELWDEVKKKHGKRSPAAIRIECIQIAAVAVKFALNFGNGG